MSRNPLAAIDPMKLNRKLWPGAKFAGYQEEIVYSVEENDETYIAAANKVGKDWIASNIVLNCFLRALKVGITCRIVTTSVAEHHLKVLWGEIGRWVTTSAAPLTAERKGPIVVNYQEIRRSSEVSSKNPLSYLVGRVSAAGEGMAGHHSDFGIAVVDEASGVKHEVYDQLRTWAHRLMIFGNCNPCSPTHFFRKGVKGGDLLAS